MHNEVIPNLEHVPERVYTRRGSTIACRAVSSYSTGVDRKVLKGKELFTIVFSAKHAAKMLMEDLYYGEYTGA